MVKVPHLIGSYNKNKNIFVIYDRKIASSLITLFYHEPVQIYKNDNGYNIIKNGSYLNINNVQLVFLIRNPISRFRSYVSERIFKQLHHIKNDTNDFKDGYEDEMFRNTDTLSIFKNISNFIYKKNNLYFLDIKKINSELLDSFTNIIYDVIIKFLDNIYSATDSNHYNKKISNLIDSIDNKSNINIIDVDELKYYFDELGIDTTNFRFKNAVSHRNILWNNMIRDFYPILKKDSKWDFVFNFTKSEIDFYKKILRHRNKIEIKKVNKEII